MLDALVVIIIVIVILVVVLIGLGIYGGVQLFKKIKIPNIGWNCHSVAQSSWLWNENCTGFIESDDTGDNPDPSIPSAVNFPLGIISFTDDGPSSPFYENVFYRYNFVDVETGNYGEFSNWTNPIMSGASTLPYLPGINGPTGSATCKSNMLTIGINSTAAGIPPIMTKPYSGDKFYGANVYRYSTGSASDASPPPAGEMGDLVGFLVPNGNYYSFVDIQGPCYGTSCEIPATCS